MDKLLFLRSSINAVFYYFTTANLKLKMKQSEKYTSWRKSKRRKRSWRDCRTSQKFQNHWRMYTRLPGIRRHERIQHCLYLFQGSLSIRLHHCCHRPFQFCCFNQSKVSFVLLLTRKQLVVCADLKGKQLWYLLFFLYSKLKSWKNWQKNLMITSKQSQFGLSGTASWKSHGGICWHQCSRHMSFLRPLCTISALTLHA